MKAILTCAVLAGSLLLSGTVAQAQGILQPSGASTDMGIRFGGYAPIHVIDQSGLSSPYISGVTAFNTYVASTTEDTGNSGNLWVSRNNTTTGNFDFDLGGIQNVDAFALWNTNSASYGVHNFNLSASNDSLFNTSTSLGSFTGSVFGVPDAAQVFTFAQTSARYVRMNITSNGGATFGTGFSEAAFRLASAAATPEPGSVFTFGALFAASGAGLCLKRWRRKAA